VLELSATSDTDRKKLPHGPYCVPCCKLSSRLIVLRILALVPARELLGIGTAAVSQVAQGWLTDYRAAD
jgi:hypothetical protein